ncbi:alkaline phosphatase PhoX [Hyphobacterium marinum]|uniref:Alkaline phosphatase PhoX n=1 Tax=Hyphobacterium marinum TaxID=3116574 RepID=A0ABU7LYX5_9PROT|nr:alkaline phosphatase PhoX [Hyphobacterium sp. Y6023]MEE2566656.1 alkaline phosphatase PhoX [Hyphobacterium sp. Y6023]
MSFSRRSFLRSAAATSAALACLPALSACSPRRFNGNYTSQVDGYGPLYRDSNGLLDLPRGFNYRIISETGREMSDGLLTPGDFDGMAAFPNADGKIVLIRNHELRPGQEDVSAFGINAERLDRIDRSRVWDFQPDGSPQLGGTTHVILNPDTLRVEREFMSLAGTYDNCAGGPTPWGSWLSCEETIERAGEAVTRDHGYVFEVPVEADGLIEPVPLRGMGRFKHEAAAVDPGTGIVYQTEDWPGHPNMFYRFIPDHPDELWRGGRLQGLAVRGQPGMDLRNWENSERVMPGTILDVDWMDLDEIDNPDGDIAARSIDQGAAHFTRGEGCWYGGEGAIYFTCTDGGPLHAGQIWRYRPSPAEGTPAERSQPGQLELFVESEDTEVIQWVDNITFAPWGDLIVAEDGPDHQYIRGVTPEGRVYTIAHNADGGDDNSFKEFCGLCFSPDGSTLFVNVQSRPGRTFAIRGPWDQRSLRA